MPVRTGAMRERVTLQRYDTPTNAWADLPTTPEVWADVSSLGDERYQVMLRYRADLLGDQDTAPAMQLLWRGRVLDILDVQETLWREQLTLTCQAHRVEIDDLGRKARRTTVWPQP